jgi:putative PIN family toxin of toxin-antitoxin system
MKVVLDTNVLISALIKAGKPRELFLNLIKQKALILSQNILDEFLEIAWNQKVQKYACEQELTTFLHSLQDAATKVQIKSKFKIIRADQMTMSFLEQRLMAKPIT